MVDDDVFDQINQHNWYYNGKYAVRQSPRQNGKQTTIWMHRVINETPDGKDTDHINRNTLDNRRDNLRSVTRSQNCMNRRYAVTQSSPYKGVSWDKEYGKWCVQICKDGKTKKFGRFLSEQEAARAYNRAAEGLFGSFAAVNSI